MAKRQKKEGVVTKQTGMVYDTTTKNTLWLENINFDPVWEFPTSDRKHTIIKKQEDFLNEYYPSGHKIFDRKYYQDIFYEGIERVKDAKTGKITKKSVIKQHCVRRIAFAIQKQAVDIFMAHYLGNPIKFEDVSFGLQTDETLINLYKDIWKTKNMESMLYNASTHAFCVGQSAIVMYRKNGVTKPKLLSYMNGDRIAVKRDISGDVVELYRKYKFIDENGEKHTYIDVIDRNTIRTYDFNNDYELVLEAEHAFPAKPFVYFYNENGTLWQFCQSQIEDIEMDFSMLCDDNQKKAKSKLFMSSATPNSVHVESMGGSDIIVGGVEDDLKMIAGAELSSQFQFTYDSIIEQIQNTLGIVFPKHKSSGDMPTGSMKMMFFPTERVVMAHIHQFNDTIDELNEMFKSCMANEIRSEYGIDITNLKVRASIDLFTPQDRSTRIQDVINLYNSGLLSLKQATDEISSLNIGNNNNYTELLEELKRKEALSAEQSIQTQTEEQTIETQIE